MKQLLLVPLLLASCKAPLATGEPVEVKPAPQDPPLPNLTSYEPELGSVDVFITTEDPKSLRVEFGPLVGTKATIIKNWSKDSPTLIIRTKPSLDGIRSDD